MTTIKSSQIAGSDTQALKYLIVPIFIFFALLIFAIIRGPQIISGSGIGTAIMVSTPLILATYALTALALSGRVTVDLSMGPLIGFINVTTIQLYGARGVTNDTPAAWAFSRARAFRIYDGPDEVHLQTIARLEQQEQDETLLEHYLLNQ